MTGPAKTEHVGTNYTQSLYWLYLSAGKEYLHSVTFIIKPIKCFQSVKKLHCHSSMLQKGMSDQSLKKYAKIMCPHALFSQTQSYLHKGNSQGVQIKKNL